MGKRARKYMKKRKAVILIMLIITGVLLFFVQINCREEEKILATGGDEVHTEQETKKIALTFDDGPHPFYTEQLLDGLKERGVVVTFFVTGEHASLHPDIIKRMQEEGHLIGNHTYSHMQLRSDNQEKFKEELQLTNQVITEITGEDILYVRPPYGAWDKSLEKELNMIPVLWTVDPLDWCSEDVGGIVRRVTEKVGENDIILMHDYFAPSVTAALQIVDTLTAQGVCFCDGGGNNIGIINICVYKYYLFLQKFVLHYTCEKMV